MNRKFNAFIATTLLSFSAFAGVKVTGVDLRTSGSQGYVNVTLEGRSNELPDIRVYGKTIEITLGQADSFNGFSKNVHGAILSANVLNGKAIIKAILPYDINPDSVNLGWKNANIEVAFPRGNRAAIAPAAAPLNVQTLPKVLTAATMEMPKSNPTPAAEPAPTMKKAESKVSKELLNEDYLNRLMKENSAKKEAAPVEVKKDVITVKQAAIAKAIVNNPVAVPSAAKASDNFSFAGYALKFAVFLALVLGLFYGVVQLLKKGVFSRGKLSFLNNTKMIEVLSTTYVAPKKSLMIVKAHNQLFLVANSENGLQFLSEMKDTNGIIKESEKLVSGSNFDTNLNLMESFENAPDLKLKVDINESAPEPRGLAKLAVAQDIVKFSDELKKKAKKLKPIEFN